MTRFNLQTVAGPRVRIRDALRHPVRYLLPFVCFASAAVLLVYSLQQPYWHMTLRAPQYPHGLKVVGYVNHLEGDVHEIDELNHYIGMRPLNDAARIEKSVAVGSIWAFAAMLLLAGVLVHNRLAVALVIAALLFPALFLLDLHYWLAHFGQHLDPHAPLSSAIKPFTPPVLGIGKIGQFRTIARAGNGLVLAAWASGLIAVGLFLHRWAYKPLVDRAKANRRRLTRNED